MEFGTVDQARVFEELANQELATVRSFRDAVADAFQREMARLEQLARQRTDEEAELIADDRWVLEEVRDLSSQLAIVSLYRVVELTTQKILRCQYTRKEDRCRLYKFDAMKKRLKKDLSLNLSSLCGYAVVNELRCLTNAVKHEGRVSKELHNTAPSRWTKGDALRDLSGHFDRFAAAIPRYILALAQGVVPAQRPTLPVERAKPSAM
jgi:hypothetical protein